MISIKLLCNFIEIALLHGCSPVNLLHIFRTPFPKNTSGWLLLLLSMSIFCEIRTEDLASLFVCLDICLCRYLKTFLPSMNHSIAISQMKNSGLKSTVRPVYLYAEFFYNNCFEYSYG